MNILVLFEAFLVFDLYFQISNDEYQVQAKGRISGESFGGLYNNALDIPIETIEDDTPYDAIPPKVEYRRMIKQEHKRKSKKRKWRKKTFRNCHRKYCSQFGSAEATKPFDIVVHIKK